MEAKRSHQNNFNNRTVWIYKINPRIYLFIYLFLRCVRRVEAYESLVRHLAMTEEASGEDTSALAVQAAVQAIRLPQVVQLDGLLGLPAIQQLATSQPQLFALLKIFAEDSLSAYTQFHHSHPAFLESVGAHATTSRVTPARAPALSLSLCPALPCSPIPPAVTMT